MFEGRGISFRFNRRVPLVEGVSLTLRAGEVIGLSGPSGCGKSTLGRLLAGHLRPKAGMMTVDGVPLGERGFRPVQYLSQTPVLAMNPRWRIGRILHELYVPPPELRAQLGVDPAWDDRFPHELSGGQLQRVSILRTLAPGVRYIIADEISSALDAIAQAELWAILLRLAKERRLGILVISHDDALLRRVADHQLAWMALLPHS